MEDIKVFNFTNKEQTSDNRAIFHENDEKMQELDKRYNRAQRIKKIAIYSSAVIVLASSIVLLKKQVNKLNQPTNIIVNDILANEGMLETDDGRKVDPKKFGIDDKDALYKYAKEHDVDPEVLREKMVQELEDKDINADLVMNQLENKYPGILNDDLVMTIEPENKAK